MKISTTLKAGLIALAITGFGFAAQAADTTVDVELDQTIDLSTLDIESADGEVNASVGSLAVGAKSQVDAVIDSTLDVQSLNASTKDGKATAQVGAVSVAN